MGGPIEGGRSPNPPARGGKIHFRLKKSLTGKTNKGDTKGTSKNRAIGKKKKGVDSLLLKK